MIACLGLQAAGGVLVPLNTRYREDETADIASHGGAASVAGSSEFIDYRYPDTLRRIGAPAFAVLGDKNDTTRTSCSLCRC